jgi:toxin ParE1/3/4
VPTFRLSAAAQEDIARILSYTEYQFGKGARARHAALLVAGLRDIAADPERVGSTSRPELGLAVRSYHLRHSRDRASTPDGSVRRPRHLLLYRTIQTDLIGIGRVLHDSMEVEAHLPHQYGDEGTAPALPG